MLRQLVSTILVITLTACSVVPPNPPSVPASAGQSAGSADRQPISDEAVQRRESGDNSQLAETVTTVFHVVLIGLLVLVVLSAYSLKRHGLQLDKR